MATDGTEWNWLFEDEGRFNWQVIIPDYAVICRFGDPGGAPRCFSVLNVQTGDRETGIDLLPMLQQVVPEIGDWENMLEVLRKEKTEDPFHRLEVIALWLEELAQEVGPKPWNFGIKVMEVVEKAEMIRTSIRRIKALPQRAHVSEALLRKAVEMVGAELASNGTAMTPGRWGALDRGLRKVLE